MARRIADGNKLSTAKEIHRVETIKEFNKRFGPGLDEFALGVVGDTYDHLMKQYGAEFRGSMPQQFCQALAAGLLGGYFHVLRAKHNAAMQVKAISERTDLSPVDKLESLITVPDKVDEPRITLADAVEGIASDIRDIATADMRERKCLLCGSVHKGKTCPA